MMQEIERMGKVGLESLGDRIKRRALQKLIDNEEEVLEWELLEAKGKALRALLNPKGPDKAVSDF